MRGQKRVLKGVHARLRRAMDARKRAYARASIFLEKSLRDGWIAPQLELARVAHHLCAASRVNPTCGVKPGNDDSQLSALISSPQPEASSPRPQAPQQRRERRGR